MFLLFHVNRWTNLLELRNFWPVLNIWLVERKCVKKLAKISSWWYKNLANILQLLDLFKCNNGLVCDSVETFCIFLKCFNYLCRIKISCTDLLDQYPSYVWSQMLCWTFYSITEVIYLRTFQQNWLLQQHREHFVDMVYDKGVSLDNFCNFLIEQGAL